MQIDYASFLPSDRVSIWHNNNLSSKNTINNNNNEGSEFYTVECGYDHIVLYDYWYCDNDDRRFIHTAICGEFFVVSKRNICEDEPSRWYIFMRHDESTTTASLEKFQRISSRLFVMKRSRIWFISIEIFQYFVD